MNVFVSRWSRLSNSRMLYGHLLDCFFPCMDKRNNGLIEDVDLRLQEWARAVVPTAEVKLESPRDSADGGVQIYVYLLDLLPDNSSVTAGRSPLLQLALRYLVTVQGGAALEAHRLLGLLVVAAMDHPEFTLELDPPPANFWSAMGLTPRPAFMLRMSLRVQRQEPKIAWVRKSIEVHHSDMTPLVGLLLGPGDMPLCGAHVALDSPPLSTHTDTKGIFRFSAVPSEPRQKRLQIRAKGLEQTVDVEQVASDAKPLVIHFEMMEI